MWLIAGVVLVWLIRASGQFPRFVRAGRGGLSGVRRGLGGAAHRAPGPRGAVAGCRTACARRPRAGIGRRSSASGGGMSCRSCSPPSGPSGASCRGQRFFSLVRFDEPLALQPPEFGNQVYYAGRDVDAGPPRGPHRSRATTSFLLRPSPPRTKGQASRPRRWPAERPLRTFAVHSGISSSYVGSGIRYRPFGRRIFAC